MKGVEFQLPQPFHGCEVAQQVAEQMPIHDFTKRAFYCPNVGDGSLLWELKPRSFFVAGTDTEIIRFYKNMAEHPELVSGFWTDAYLRAEHSDVAQEAKRLQERRSLCLKEQGMTVEANTIGVYLSQPSKPCSYVDIQRMSQVLFGHQDDMFCMSEVRFLEQSRVSRRMGDVFFFEFLNSKPNRGWYEQQLRQLTVEGIFVHMVCAQESYCVTDNVVKLTGILSGRTFYMEDNQQMLEKTFKREFAQRRSLIRKKDALLKDFEVKQRAIEKFAPRRRQLLNPLLTTDKAVDAGYSSLLEWHLNAYDKKQQTES